MKQLKVNKAKTNTPGELEVEVLASVEIANKAYSMALKTIAENVDFPGFRKGKVPREIIEQRFGSGYINQKAFENIFSDVISDAIEQENLEVVEVIKVLSYELYPGKPFNFKALLELRPEVKLGKSKDLKIKAHKIVYDKENFLKQTIENLRSNLATYQDVDKRGIIEGDLINVDFEGVFDEGVPVPGGKAEKFDIVLEKDKFLPEFVEQLQGVKIGESKDVKVTFPENYSKDCSGRSAKFEVKVHSIKEKVLLKVDEAFAQKLGLNSLEALNEKILEQMYLLQDSASNKDFENKLIEELVNTAEFKISQRMLEKEKEYLLNDIRANWEKSGGSWNDFVADKKNQELLGKASEAAHKRIAIDLVLNTVVKEQSIVVTQNELSQEVKSRAMNFGQQQNAYEKDPRFVEMVRLFLLRDKAINFLVKNNEPQWEEKKLSDVPK